MNEQWSTPGGARQQKKRGGCLKYGLIGLVVVLVLLIIVVIVGGGNDDGDSSSSSAPLAGTASSASETEESTTTVGEGVLGDYYIKLTGVTVAEDYDGNPALIVNYDFTNNSDEAANAMWSLNIDVFQNGLELETAVIADSSVYDSGQSMRDIQTGATLSCQDAFVLEDTTSPVEIHVSELISFDDTEVTATYNLE